MKNSTIYLYGLILIGLFVIGLLLSFNSGFKQGVRQAKDCLDNKGFIELGFNNFECKIEHNSTFVNDFEKYINFTGGFK